MVLLSVLFKVNKRHILIVTLRLGQEVSLCVEPGPVSGRVVDDLELVVGVDVPVLALDVAEVVARLDLERAVLGLEPVRVGPVAVLLVDQPLDLDDRLGSRRRVVVEELPARLGSS